MRALLALAAGFGGSAVARGADPAAARAPHGFACLTPATAGRVFCDARAPLAARVADLVGALTPAEKIGLLGAAGGDTCSVIDAGAPRLGLAPVTQLIEVTGAVSSACVADAGGDVRCPTVFPAPLALAASFNRSLMREKGRVTGVEARALNNAWATRIYSALNYVDLLAFGPDLNVIVDPRNGRNGENPSEDPYLTGAYAVEVVRGAQEGEDAAHVMLSMAVKHFALYQMETDRFGSNANATNFDLLDTYLPPYAAAFTEGRASGSMCAYDAINDVPACADHWLLTDMVRGFWGRPDAYVLSDCGAIEDQVTAHHTAANVSDAAARSIKAGCDGCAGSGFIVDGGVAGALASGELAQADVDAALSRLLQTRFKLGMFDPPAASAYTAYGLDRVGAPAARAEAAAAAAQGAVLLVNDGALPLALPPSLRALAVLGPHAVSKRDLLGDFYGDAFCEGISNRTQRADACVPTFGDAVVDALAARGRGDVAITVAEGVAIDAPDASGAAAATAVAAAAAADATLLFLGYSNALIEREGADHNYTTLPPGQAAFAAAVLAAAKGPVVLVLVNAGAIALDTLPRAPNALVEAWYPSFGAPAVVEQLLGATNRWGRMPVTVYEAAFASRVALADASVSGPGARRTWRYYNGTPNYDFGAGLSYARFALTCSTASPLAFNTTVGAALRVAVHCESALLAGGAPAGDAILLARHAAGADVRAAVGGAHPVPRGSLRGFDRVALPGAGGSDFVFEARDFALVDAVGASVLVAGTHEVSVDGFGGARWAVNVTLAGPRVVLSAPPPLPAAAAR
jgi:beta-glucosidase-like glycosyl hydrolase